MSDEKGLLAERTCQRAELVEGEVELVARDRGKRDRVRRDASDLGEIQCQMGEVVVVPRRPRFVAVKRRPVSPDLQLAARRKQARDPRDFSRRVPDAVLAATA